MNPLWIVVMLALCLTALVSPRRAVAAGSTVSLSLRAALPQADIQEKKSVNFRVEHVAADAMWVPEIISRADAARRIVNDAMPDALLVAVDVILAPDKQTFLELSGTWAENSIAVAVPRQLKIVINGDAIRSGPAEGLGTTLVHEFVHLYLGLRCKTDLPRWFDEGVAMNAAGEWGVEDSAAVTLGALVGGLIPLREIESHFPVQADRQRVAYRQSYSVVRYMASARSSSLSAFVKRYIGDDGVGEIGRLWNPLYRDALEVEWRKSLRSFRNWTLLTFSSGLFWGVAAGLTVLAWYIKRRRTRALRDEWDDDERIYEALDEEEQRIWGDEDHAVVEDEDEPRPPWYA